MFLLKRKFVFMLLLLQVLPGNSLALEFSGSSSLELRGFFEEGQFAGQDRIGISPSIEPELTHTWNNDRDTFAAKLFFRFDSTDSDRTHFDIRQLDWTKVVDDFEIRLGFRKVFWGVTESVHLIDFINQTDLIENFDGEDKLGQFMVNASWISPAGTFDFFVMPYFRERTHPGTEGRFRFAIPVRDSAEVYESDLNEFHPDVALRWFHSMGLVDIGLYHFYGTNREPRYVLDANDPATPFLRPQYDLVNQSGLDAQLTWEGWLLKLEALSRFWQDHYFAAATGFEYTFYGIFKSTADLGVVAEYLYDDRGSQATTPFENDVFAALRFARNDENDLTILGGVIVDLDSEGVFANLEASSRIGQNLEWSLESRFFLASAPADFFASFRNDSYAQFELTYYF